ncbi:MAG: WecB/TagA/CpsF family glycosyltransferase [Candidatus Moranbacteria bacterium]|nr:WecB/TagA/CpsF family glycosyltransferase [Candidatus Moranbacteria bacterium]
MSSSIQKILGVKINNLSRKEILEKIELFLDSEKFHQITTTNAEFILEAQKDEEFRKIINESDLSVADTISIWYAFIRHFKLLKTRFSGIDLMQEILNLAEKKNISVFLVARKDGLSSWRETRKVILKSFPDLNIEGIDVKFQQGVMTSCSCEKKQIVFCNFGAPMQDKFIYSLQECKQGVVTPCSRICLGMGMGGSFDFLTGKVKRAPKWMRILGFEWLYRLIKQPNRWRRIFKAVIVFPIRVIFKK